MDMQTVRPKKGTRCIHIETALAVINIYIGLVDVDGQRVENIQIQPNQYAGEQRVWTDPDVRGVRLIEEKKHDEEG